MIPVQGRIHTRRTRRAQYLKELLNRFETEGVDSVFVYTFALYTFPHRSAAYEYFDMASTGVVKVFESGRGQRYLDMPWEPKVAFTRLAEYYRS